MYDRREGVGGEDEIGSRRDFLLMVVGMEWSGLYGKWRRLTPPPPPVGETAWSAWTSAAPCVVVPAPHNFRYMA